MQNARVPFDVGEQASIKSVNINWLLYHQNAQYSPRRDQHYRKWSKGLFAGILACIAECSQACYATVSGVSYLYIINGRAYEKGTTLPCERPMLVFSMRAGTTLLQGRAGYSAAVGFEGSGSWHDLRLTRTIDVVFWSRTMILILAELSVLNSHYLSLMSI